MRSRGLFADTCFIVHLKPDKTVVDMTDTAINSAEHSASAIYHRHFGPALPQSNWVPAPRYLLRRDRVMRHLKNLMPCRVLDIGCGPAALLSELAEQGFEAYGVDRSQQALELADKLNTQASPMTLLAELDPAIGREGQAEGGDQYEADRQHDEPSTAFKLAIDDA